MGKVSIASSRMGKADGKVIAGIVCGLEQPSAPLVKPLKSTPMKNTFTWAEANIATALASCGTRRKTTPQQRHPRKNTGKRPGELTGGRYTTDSAASTVNWKGTEITEITHRHG